MTSIFRFTAVAVFVMFQGTAFPAVSLGDGPGAKPAAAPAAKQATPPSATAAAGAVAAGEGGTATATGTKGTATTASRAKQVPFAELLKDVEPVDGLIKLYRKENRLYGELNATLFDRDLIVLISIARGIGEGMILGGMSLGFGDDWIWQFRKADDKVQIVRRNVRFSAAKGSPEERAVHLAYTDSVLFSLPVATTSPAGNVVVELTPVFMSDLAQISAMLRGFVFSAEKSSWASVKGFKDNVEIQVAATYTSSGTERFDTVPDSRGATINVHYSISLLPQTGYQPRLADDRVGYFLTVTKDFSKKAKQDRFVRYINRWDLRKADPTAELSPPKKPIIFWLEKTIPYEYRKPIREGILEWNKAYEKAGFANAIEVRQQPDDATWDPEDINYNTFRWITAGAAFAMGPSRVNPLTGEILDADIIFDADFLQRWKEDFEMRTVHGATTGEAAPHADPLRGVSLRACPSSCCDMAYGMAQQLALGSIALAEPGKPGLPAEFQKVILQAIKSITIHEVGHTLGLRHNFKGSTLLTLEEINNPEKTKDSGFSGSIMDYLPVNFVPKGRKQGDYFSGTIGPYDYWAIEYGYKTLPGANTEAELPELSKIASRCAEPALAYATDEDTRGNDPDPLSNRFDLGKDPLQFVKWQTELIDQLWPTLIERVTKNGEGYERVRRAFNILLMYHGNAMHYAGRFVGGGYVYRDHKGDPNARPPFVVVEAARQREALNLVVERLFTEKSFQLPTDLFAYLSGQKWLHWGVQTEERADYPIRDTILMWQDRALSQFLSSLTLSRLLDAELRVPADKDAFTAAELFERLTGAIFQELDGIKDGKYTNRKPAISALRRSLQRHYLERLSNLAMGNVPSPEDAQTLAYSELTSLESRLNQVLNGKAQLDAYTRAHLKESAARIRKVLDARLQLKGP